MRPLFFFKYLPDEPVVLLPGGSVGKRSERIRYRAVIPMVLFRVALIKNFQRSSPYANL